MTKKNDHNAALTAVDAAEQAVPASPASHVAPTRTHELRMNAYWFSFRPTGVELVDRVLSAVARAGKGYHHTEYWVDDIEDFDCFRGGSYAAWIQFAADDAAASQKELLEALRALLVDLEGHAVVDGRLAAAEAAIRKAEGR